MSKPFAITPVHDLLLRGSTDLPVGLYHLHLTYASERSYLSRYIQKREVERSRTRWPLPVAFPA